MSWARKRLLKYSARYRNHRKLIVYRHYIVYFINTSKHIDDIEPDLRKSMINDNLEPDVVFLVGDQRFPAHKRILQVSNEQFYIKHVEPHQNSHEIEIEHVDPKGFQQFLRFLHFGDLNLNPLNVMPTFDVAQVYQHSTLLNLCSNHICDNIHVSNVLEILDWNLQHQNYRIMRSCREVFIDNATEILIESDKFQKISKQLLKIILSWDVMNCSEVLLFKETKKWAEAQCLEQNIDPLDANKYNILEDLLCLFRVEISRNLEVLNEFPLNPRLNRFCKQRFDNLFIQNQIEQTWEEFKAADDDFICYGFSIILSNLDSQSNIVSEHFLMTIESESDDLLLQKEFEIKVHEYLAMKDFVFEVPLTMQKKKRHFLTVKFIDSTRSRYLEKDESSGEVCARILRIYD